jgi:hypothetical protein
MRRGRGDGSEAGLDLDLDLDLMRLLALRRLGTIIVSTVGSATVAPRWALRGCA